MQADTASSSIAGAKNVLVLGLFLSTAIRMIQALLAAVLLVGASAYDNGVARLPPMGWVCDMGGAVVIWGELLNLF